MRPAEFSDQAIINAGEQLVGKGKRVTGFAIRNIVGGGKPERLKKVWDTHVDSTKETDPAPKDLSLPAEFGDAVESLKTVFDNLAERLFLKAQEVSESRVRDTLETMKQREEESKAEVDEALLTVETVETESAELNNVIEGLKATVGKFQQENAELRGKLQSNAAQTTNLIKELGITKQELVQTRTERDIAIGELKGK